MRYRINYYCWSDIGKHRKINQDNYICNGKYYNPGHKIPSFPIKGSFYSDQSALLGVFDGLGGLEHGEKASLIAAKTASGCVIRENPIEDLLRFCLMANEKICRYSDDHGMDSMGTTAALLAFTDTGISLCNIGDSKIFRFSHNQLEQISTDHYGIAAHGSKPPLSQNLGIPSTELMIDPYVARGYYEDGDIYLICSDGLTDMLSTEDISRILKENSIEKSVEELMKEALANGGKDNITVILCRVEQEHYSFFDKLTRFFQR